MHLNILYVLVGKLQLSKHCADGTFFQLVFWVADYRAIIPEIKRYVRSFATLFINPTLNFSLLSEPLYLPDKVDSFHKSDYRTKMSYVKDVSSLKINLSPFIPFIDV